MLLCSTRSSSSKRCAVICVFSHGSKRSALLSNAKKMSNRSHKANETNSSPFLTSKRENEIELCACGGAKIRLEFARYIHNALLYCFINTWVVTFWRERLSSEESFDYSRYQCIIIASILIMTDNFNRPKIIYLNFAQYDPRPAHYFLLIWRTMLTICV